MIYKWIALWRSIYHWCEPKSKTTKKATDQWPFWKIILILRIVEIPVEN